MNKIMSMLITTFATIVASSMLRGENLLRNAGFEEVDNQGRMAEWDIPKSVYRWQDGVGENGSRGIVYENADTNVYKMVIQRKLPIKNGYFYKCSARFNIDNLEGEGSGVRICMEYYDKNGKWIYGTYANKGKRDGGVKNWRTIECSTMRPIPENTASVTFNIFVDRNNTGKVYFDNVSVEEFIQPVVMAIVTSAYRNCATGGVLRVNAPLLLAVNGYSAADMEAKICLSKASGKMVQEFPVTELSNTALKGEVNLDIVPEGNYNLTVKICDKKTKQEVGSRTVTFQRVAKLPERKVYFDEHRRLIVDGKPFFPLGMYLGHINKRDMNILAGGPFNCVMPYWITKWNDLDLAWSNKIHVIYSVKDMYAGLRMPHSATLADEEAAITKLVNDHKDHPAVLAWYLNDELPLVPYKKQLDAHARLLERLDPSHPSWIVLGDEVPVGYEDSYDVLGLDYYPIPLESCGIMLGKTERTVARTFNARPVWMVPQATAKWEKAVPGKPRMRRFPSLFEARSMAWQCIAGGANGIVFYAFFDMVNEKGRPADVSFAEQWYRVCEAGRELLKYAPVMLSIEPVPTLTKKASDKVGVRAWRHEGKLYVLAVNSGKTAENISLTIDAKIGSVVADFGPKNFNVSSGTISCSLAAFEPAMFVIECK